MDPFYRNGAIDPSPPNTRNQERGFRHFKLGTEISIRSHHGTTAKGPRTLISLIQIKKKVATEDRNRGRIKERG